MWGVIRSECSRAASAAHGRRRMDGGEYQEYQERQELERMSEWQDATMVEQVGGFTVWDLGEKGTYE